MTAIRAVVVDDSAFMRRLVSDVLEDGGVDVVATARDGAAGVDAVIEHEPDVVTMDVRMPDVDGLEAVDRIMATRPTPILMLSAHTAEGADVTFDALERGAVDFFPKPGGERTTDIPEVGDDLVARVEAVAGVDVTVERGRRNHRRATANVASDATVVLAASTGGPTAVETVLKALPLAAELRVLLVQHMPASFTGRFAERLDARSAYDVREASDGDRIGGGEILVARGDSHLEVSRFAGGRIRVRLTDDPEVHGVKPAADPLFESAASVVDGPLIAVVLTGMGRDAAEGVRAVSAAGGHVIAQDRASSAVYGMPGAAVETGCVDDVVPIDDVAAAVVDAVGRCETA